MKKIGLKKIALVGCLLAVGACSRIDNGYVGIEVNQYGSDRGVQQEVLGPGTYMTGINTSIYEYPSYTVNYVYSKSADEGKAADESVTFQAKGGVAINADFGIAYHVEKANVPVVFQKYHEGIESITAVPLRNTVRDSLNAVAGEMSFEDIANDIPGFMVKVNTEVQRRALLNGITVESVSNIGKFRWPPAIEASINAQLQAKMDTITSQNQLQKTQADAAKRIANSAADLQIATNEAQATAIRGQALAKNPEILQQMWIEKWDGRVAQNQFGPGTGVQVQLPKLGQ